MQSEEEAVVAGASGSYESMGAAGKEGDGDCWTAG